MIASSAYSESAPRYTLRSDLYRACLPQAAEDTGRRLIWMNTVCLLFLAGGILGIAHPPGLVLQKFSTDPAAQTRVKVQPDGRMHTWKQTSPLCSTGN